MRTLGRCLQFFGIVLLPLAVLMEATGQLARSGGLSDMLLLFLFGVAAFYLGRFVEGYAAR